MLKHLLQEGQQSEVVLAQHKEDVNKALALSAIDVVLYDLPFLNDAKEMTFLISIKEMYPQSNVLLLLAAKHVEKVRSKVEKYGVFVISKPIQRESLFQFLSFIRATSQTQKNQKNQKKLVNKIAEIKRVDLAKSLLIENEYLTEPMAHRLIEKKAMDSRRKRIEIAEDIIRKYQRV